MAHVADALTALRQQVLFARDTVSRYPQGGAVTVYYHPRRPAVATLERRASGFLWLPTGLFLACGIAGALVGWWD